MIKLMITFWKCEPNRMKRERCRTSSRNTGLDGDTLIRWQSGEGGLISDDDDDDEDDGDGHTLIKWQSGEGELISDEGELVSKRGVIRWLLHRWQIGKKSKKKMQEKKDQKISLGSLVSKGVVMGFKWFLSAKLSQTEKDVKYSAQKNNFSMSATFYLISLFKAPCLFCSGQHFGTKYLSEHSAPKESADDLMDNMSTLPPTLLYKSFPSGTSRYIQVPQKYLTVLAVSFPNKYLQKYLTKVPSRYPRVSRSTGGRAVSLPGPHSGIRLDHISQFPGHLATAVP